MDPVNKKAVKKDFDDRKDKDIDNDGDVDSSDEYLHKRRKAVSKAIAAKKNGKKDEGVKNNKMDDVEVNPQIDEKKLTPAEMKKREEIAKAMERENPDMPMGQKMAIATAQAKKVAEVKSAPKGYHFTRSGKLKKGDADQDGDGGAMLRSDPLDKQRKKIPPLPESLYMKIMENAIKKKS
jgi:hypothetical protein